ncbi:unnamed protein product [Neospora caninum Liverpool]|uniref:Uncharacterized protein n=1 Tax=Neospora caninum (strain Liverpool) TaxID=572307 RepID=F0VC18_NEOCL|nr:uncharacterized protein NCLIV_042261 [Neospora caninum Liverpool]CBZ51152.1 unnamed protein product [Neospora caninum Liverpool]|eukprot:XP_003881185.1 uncharacterized protein NCLIV_042261 [Neospora caninum Liverpool]
MDSAGGGSRGRRSRSRSGSVGQSNGRSASTEKKDSKSRRRSQTPDSGRRRRSSNERQKMRRSKWDSKVSPSAAASSSASPATSSTATTCASLGFVMPTVKDTPTVYSTPLVLGAAQDQAAAATAISNTLNSRLQPPPPAAPPPPAVGGAPASGAHALQHAMAAAQSLGSGRGYDAEFDRKHRRLYVGNLPPGSTQPDVVGFFNGALLAVNAQTGFVKEDEATHGEKLLPVERCEVFNESSRFCFIELRSEQYAILCVSRTTVSLYAWEGHMITWHHQEATPHTRLTFLFWTTRRRSKGRRRERSRLARKQAQTTRFISRTFLPRWGKSRYCPRPLGAVWDAASAELDQKRADWAAQGLRFLRALNGFVCGANMLSVQRANFSGPVVTRDTNRTMTVTSLPNSMTQKLLSDPLVAVQIDPKEYEAICDDIKQEAEKHGALEEVLVPKPNEDLSYREGVGKVRLRAVPLLQTYAVPIGLHLTQNTSPVATTAPILTELVTWCTCFV